MREARSGRAEVIASDGKRKESGRWAPATPPATHSPRRVFTRLEHSGSFLFVKALGLAFPCSGEKRATIAPLAPGTGGDNESVAVKRLK